MNENVLSTLRYGFDKLWIRYRLDISIFTS